MKTAAVVLKMAVQLLKLVAELLEGEGADVKRVEEVWASSKTELARAEAEDRRRRRREGS